MEPERVQMFHMSSAMAAQFVKAASDMTEQIAKLGPSPLSRQLSEWAQTEADEDNVE
jgi:F420-non-reducing hydrogenase iron-sulfur subunit